ncbi:hypothetical protein [Streptomyces ossamyceticus]|uniref:Uncharacterized protein n=1 Tax=Streptomyces ossamyceticus TaxID=249581 RepID=A0ABV2UR34_9ACTN
MHETNSGGRRRTLATAFAAAFATVFTVQGASPAHAASPYDGADPAATGCASNAKTLASAPLHLIGTTRQVATIEMRYRTLARCSTLQGGGVGHPAPGGPEGRGFMAGSPCPTTWLSDLSPDGRDVRPAEAV